MRAKTIPPIHPVTMIAKVPGLTGPSEKNTLYSDDRMSKKASMINGNTV
ncbi:hypothetical protein QQ054_08630 [Oscillatoria amoena NRMC-F 0135]|nr:hypothetical protein [Oscillatoria amoena NRMC-F 0135]